MLLWLISPETKAQLHRVSNLKDNLHLFLRLLLARGNRVHLPLWVYEGEGNLLTEGLHEHPQSNASDHGALVLDSTL